MDNGGLSTILLDKHHLTVGETVTLFCHGLSTSATDWIGLFHTGDVDSISNCLDYKQGGNTLGKRGLKWLIANTINFGEADNKCLFKYINGASGRVKAISQVIHIINTDLEENISPSGTLNTLFSGQLLEFTITGMEAHNLKRTLFGRPCPYVKVGLRPGRMQRKAWRSHHGQIGKTRCQVNTTEPSWSDEIFEFKASIWDILEVEVRNRSTGIKPIFSRFLGKLHFPLRELLTKGRNKTQTFTGRLMKREPSRKILGTFSLTIKTDRDLPGSRNSRRQASPDSLDSGDPNGELVNGTGSEHPDSEGDRRPSPNPSTPDDDLSLRERTSTVPIPPPRAMAQVFIDQSTAAQSQPDLLGLPYTTHENVLRRRNLDLSLSITGELTSELNSRLSMPPFVFSSTSLRSFENLPSTSSSFATDMASRPVENDQENTSENSDVDNISLNEPVSTNLNSELEESPSNMQTLSDNSLSMNGTAHVVTEDERNENATPLTNSEIEGNNAAAENPTNTLPCSDPILNEGNSDRSIEMPEAAANDLSLNNCNEESSHLSEQQTSADTAISDTVLQEDVLDTNDGNNEVNSEVNDTEEFSPEETVDAIAEQSASNVPLAEPDLPVSADSAHSSENSSVSTVAQSSQHEVLTAVLPPDEQGSSFREHVGPVNEVDEVTSSNVYPGQMDDGNQSYSLAVNDSSTETEDSSGTGLLPSHSERMDETQNPIRQMNSTFRSFENDSFMFGRGDSFMDLESEPDIMNVLSLSNNTTSDVIMPTNSADVEGTSPRRTVGTCNLRTLFQIPDRENSTRTRIHQDDEDSVGVGVNNMSQGDNTVQEDQVNFVERENIENSDSALVVVSSNTHESENVSRSLPSSRTSEVVDSTFALFGVDDSELDGNSDNDRRRLENATTDAASAIGNTTGESLSQNTSAENSDASTAADISQSSNDELTSPAPIPSITHVRYLRSKHLSIRLPSRTASPLPVVHVVPSNIPVSANDSSDDLPGSSIEAEPVLPATRLDPPVRESTPIVSRSLARDVFDAPDGSGDDVNVGASTSNAVSSLQQDILMAQVSSASGVSHSAQSRKSSSSSQSGNARNKKKNKSRSRTSRDSSTTEPTEGAESTSGQARVGRRAGEERANRTLTTADEPNDESASSNRGASIYVQISDFPSDEDVLDEPLPQHWERAVDSYNRVYYIDHENRITTWIRPSAASASETSLNEVNHHRQNLDRRYQSFRRTLSGRRRRRSYDEAANATISNETSSANETSTSTTPTVSTRSATNTDNSTTSSSAARGISSRSNEATPNRPTTSDNRQLLNSTFVKFLTRPDFISFLRNSGAAGQYYFNHPEVKDMVKRIREDPRNYLRFMHDRSLVTFLNGFADASQPLPRGWEQKTDQFGQKYFVDHNSRSTNFADPRLPDDSSQNRNRSRGIETAYADPIRRPPPPGMQRATAVNSTASSHDTSRRNQAQRLSGRMSYNQQIVEFLRQANINDILSARDSSYANNIKLKCIVDKIRRDGQRALRFLSDNVDLIVLLSLFEDDIVSWVPGVKLQKPAATDKKRNLHIGPDDPGPSSRKTSKPAPYKRDFQAKVKSLHEKIAKKDLGQGPNKIQLVIRREHILEDAFDQLMKQNPKTLQKSKLEVKFSGEEGLDYGGPQREFFFLISRQLFNPYYGLFEYSAQDTYTLHISSMSSFVDNAHDWYRFSGRIIALVIIHQHLLDAFFTRPFYKLLLKSSCDLRDVEALDALFHQSLAWIMESDITDVSLDLSFTVNEELGGQVNERELLPGGRDIRVTEDNKLGYVELMSNWRIDRGVSDQRKSILKGFYEIIDYELVSVFDACELELLISGTADIDINDWFSHTEYRSGYHPNHKVIRWFWQAVHCFDNEQRLRLLQFVTGTSSVPYEGFAALRGSTGLRKFCIEKWGNHTMLPRAHTCFNRLDLPAYQSYNELLEKLTLAVEETSTFGIQ
ncbi:E3 ubiquitin-protein ligase HECW2-like [Dendronephthya gigantea]|uniref:E3 ubiquitin-protein ligase HECW2-like n=1 Tax=Dendronephthya gigantea TaxID=151771 RepID=UPI00106D91CA|nr:E3 ubiquitin-protein ligase HECW2-like [Dendronephthya gigantea]